MEGTGNDYIYIDLSQNQIDNPASLAVAMSDRHYGVGSDGIVLIGPSEQADISMQMYNADGTPAEMCGNAIRCVGKYVWDYNIVKKQDILVETIAGNLKVTIIHDQNNEVSGARVAMGVPILQAEKLPSTLNGEIIEQSFDFENFSLYGTLVSMGNPHLVTFVDDIENIPIEEWGSTIENDPRFPNRINIEFIQVISSKEIVQRTWERGTGETLACGTGASAACVAGVLTQRTQNIVTNHLIGGDLKLTWEGKGEILYMEGDAREVFHGTYLLKKQNTENKK